MNYKLVVFVFIFVSKYCAHDVWQTRRWINSFIYDFMMHMPYALSMNWIEKQCSGFESFDGEFITRESNPIYENTVTYSRSFLFKLNLKFFTSMLLLFKHIKPLWNYLSLFWVMKWKKSFSRWKRVNSIWIYRNVVTLNVWPKLKLISRL